MYARDLCTSLLFLVFRKVPETTHVPQSREMVKESIQHLYIIEYSAAGKKNGAVMAWKDV